MKLRALIVDDEPLARERLRTLLKADPEVEIAAECADGRKAIAAIHKHAPDLVFLDVQMPEVDGFAVIEAVGPARMPAVIFVTAYDKYALRAFEVHALDYLLKPFDRERFTRALERAKTRLQHDAAGRSGELGPRLLALLEALKAGARPVERLVIKSGGRVIFLRAEEIDWIEAAGNYVRLHAGREAHLLRETMSALEARLDAGRFRRIHRSTMVQLDRIKEMQPDFHGDYQVLLRDGTRLTLSRTYREKFREFLGDSL